MIECWSEKRQPDEQRVFNGDQIRMLWGTEMALSQPQRVWYFFPVSFIRQHAKSHFVILSEAKDLVCACKL
jgi:hypothetical protein